MSSSFNEDFIEYQKALRRECNYLFCFISLYLRLFDKFQQRPDIFNMTPAFWFMIRKALHDSIVLSVTKLFGIKEKRGIFNFLKFIEANLSEFTLEKFEDRIKFEEKHLAKKFVAVDSEAIQSDRQKLGGLEDILESFKTRRDKYIAHLDENFFYEPKQSEKDAPVQMVHLNEIREVVDSIFNKYSKAFNGKEYKIGATDIDDVDVILSILQEHRDRYFKPMVCEND